MTEPRDWADAACRGRPVDWWFPPRRPGPGGMAGNVARGIEVCSTCPRQADCIDWSIAQPDHLDGVWGGLRPGERDREREWRRLHGQPRCDLCGEPFLHLLALRRHVRRSDHRWLSHPTRTMTRTITNTERDSA